MRQFIFFVVAFTFITPVSSSEQLNQQLEKEAKTHIKQFASQLKSTLSAGVKSGGLIQGIEVCSDSAAIIANAHSTDEWQIGRTSLRVRNSNNMPDAWEKAQLQRFEKRKAAGEDVKMMAFSQIITLEDNSKVFRFMKPIPTGALCLNCHGHSINSDVKSLINIKYPKDKATDFKLGDIRGAFTLSKRL